MNTGRRMAVLGAQPIVTIVETHGGKSLAENVAHIRAGCEIWRRITEFVCVIFTDKSSAWAEKIVDALPMTVIPGLKASGWVSSMEDHEGWGAFATECKSIAIGGRPFFIDAESVTAPYYNGGVDADLDKFGQGVHRVEAALGNLSVIWWPGVTSVVDKAIASRQYDIIDALPDYWVRATVSMKLSISWPTWRLVDRLETFGYCRVHDVICPNPSWSGWITESERMVQAIEGMKWPGF